MVGQRCEIFDESRARVGAGRQVPLRLVDDRPKALLAAHLEDVAKLRVHFVALTVRQVQPRRKQLVRLGLLHGRKVQIAEQLPRLRVASEQGIWHLPEEVLG